MAFDATPTTHISGLSEDGTDLTIPLASIAELTAAEADASSGDIRQITHGLAEMLFKVYDDMAEADLPTKVSATRTDRSIDASTLERTISFTFELGVTAGNVVAES